MTRDVLAENITNPHGSGSVGFFVRAFRILSLETIYEEGFLNRTFANTVRFRTKLVSSRKLQTHGQITPRPTRETIGNELISIPITLSAPNRNLNNYDIFWSHRSV